MHGAVPVGSTVAISFPLGCPLLSSAEPLPVKPSYLRVCSMDNFKTKRVPVLLMP